MCQRGFRSQAFIAKDSKIAKSKYGLPSACLGPNSFSLTRSPRAAPFVIQSPGLQASLEGKKSGSCSEHSDSCEFPRIIADKWHLRIHGIFHQILHRPFNIRKSASHCAHAPNHDTFASPMIAWRTRKTHALHLRWEARTRKKKILSRLWWVCIRSVDKATRTQTMYASLKYQEHEVKIRNIKC